MKKIIITERHSKYAKIGLNENKQEQIESLREMVTSLDKDNWELAEIIAKGMEIRFRLDVVSPIWEGIAWSFEALQKVINYRELTFEAIYDFVIPPGIALLQKLRTIFIKNFDTVTISKYVGELSNLEKLYIQNGVGLLTFSKEVGNLSSLKNFTIREHKGNVILPENIGNLSNLEELAIYNCPKFNQLPTSVANLNNLKRLVLYRCSLTTISDGISNLPNLELISLASNKISREEKQRLRTLFNEKNPNIVIDL